MDRYVEFVENPSPEFLTERRAKMKAVAADLRRRADAMQTIDAVLDALESGTAQTMTVREVAEKLN
jgi:hypothetical protein